MTTITIHYVALGPTEDSDYAEGAWHPYFFATKKEALAYISTEAMNEGDVISPSDEKYNGRYTCYEYGSCSIEVDVNTVA